MKAGRTNATGQLKPLNERTSEAAQERRQAKNEYRRRVSIEHGKTRWALKLTHDKLITYSKRFIITHIVEGIAIAYLLYRVLGA